MTLLTVNPSASNHDAHQAGTAMTLTGNVQATAGTHWMGLLLPAVGIVAGATINSATLYYRAVNMTHDDPDLNWYAQAADSAGVFTTTASDISDRPRTTAVTQDTATGIGTGAYRSVNITSQIAEVIGRGGWASGNNIALIGDARSASADLYIISQDTGGNVWYVEINYTAAQNYIDSVSLGRSVGATSSSIAGAQGLATLGRRAAVSPVGVAGALGIVVMSRKTLTGLGPQADYDDFDDASQAAALGAIPLPRSMGSTLSGIAAALGALGLGRAEGVSVSPATAATAALLLARNADLSGSPAVQMALALALGRALGLAALDEADAGQDVTEALALGRALGAGALDGVSALDAVLLARGAAVSLLDVLPAVEAVGLARTLGAAATAGAAALDALLLARALEAAAGPVTGIAEAAVLARGLTATAAGQAAADDLLLLAAALGVTPDAAAATADSAALGRSMDAAAAPSAGVLMALALGRAAGITAADGFTVLEAVVLAKALGAGAVSQAGMSEALVLNLARLLAGDATAAAVGSLPLGMGRSATFLPVTAGQEAITLAGLLGMTATAGMALWEAIDLGAARGLTATETLGRLEALVLARSAGVATAEALAAREALLLALGHTAAVDAATDAAEDVSLSREMGAEWAGVAALLESVGIGIFRMVAANGAVRVALTTPRHVVVVDEENRVWAIGLERQVVTVKSEARIQRIRR